VTTRIVPGLCDLQVNGAAGYEVTGDDEALDAIEAALIARGVTRFLATVTTVEDERAAAAVERLARRARDPGSAVAGIHLEGPFLSPEHAGVHPVELLRAPADGVPEHYGDPAVRLVTLAPELPGALDLVDLLHARGVVVSLGHTNATASEAHAAFDRGVRAVTHVFNAMRPLAHRDPGVVGAALIRPDVVLQAIVDGVHLAPDIVRLLWRVGAGRLSLVTDAIAGAGLGDGTYALGEIEIVVADDVVRSGDGVLAGSALTMIEAVRNLVAVDVPLERALEAATSIPARVLGERALGRLAPGARADIVVLDDALEVVRTLVGGETRVAG